MSILDGGPKRPTRSIAATKYQWAQGVDAGDPIQVPEIQPEDYLISAQGRIRSTGTIIPYANNGLDEFFISANGGHLLSSANTDTQDLFITWYDRHQSPSSSTYGDPQLGRGTDWNPGTKIPDISAALNSMLYGWWAPEMQKFVAASGTGLWDFGDVDMSQEEFDTIKRYAVWHAKSGSDNKATVDGLAFQPINGAGAFDTTGLRPSMIINGRQWNALTFGQDGGLSTIGPGVKAAIPDDFSEEWTFSIVLQTRQGSGHVMQLGATSLFLDTQPTTGEGANLIVSPFNPVDNEPFVITCIYQTDGATSKLLVNNLAPVIGNTGTNTFTGPETMFIGCADNSGAESNPQDMAEIVLGRPEQVFTGGVGPSTADQYGTNVHDYLMRKYRFRGIPN